MDDETKDFSELNLESNDNDDENSFDNTIEINDEVLNDETISDDEIKIDEENAYDDNIEVGEERLLTVKEQLKEIKEDEINNKIDEIKEVQKNNKKLNKTLIILLAVLFILILVLVSYLLFFKKDKPAPTPIDNNKNVINRPSDNLEYIILKQNQITLNCNKTKDGEKITSLKKGLVIECDFVVNSSQNINELYFDLENSSNLKIKEFKNTTDYELINDKKTYKLTSNDSFNKIENNIKFYYEVTDANEKTGYVEIKNIVFKDNKDSYYKMINNIVAFPPEYNDKIYIYKQSLQNNETYYVGSKTLLNNEEYLELVDTYKCSSEDCEVKDNSSNYFVIYDNGLTVYDVLLRTKQKVKINDTKFDYNNYGYEIISNKDNDLLGILFKKNYVDNSDCDENLNVCVETSISGYEVSYYSTRKNMFTIALDYGFVGANVYTDYDEALLLEKDNKYGIFSYEDDDMIVNLSKKYKSIEYDAEVNLVKFGLYDSKNNQNYYTYYDLKTSSFKINTKADYMKKLNSSNIYYISETNKQGNTIYMLYNSKGEIFKDLPYVLNNQIELADNNTLIIKNNGMYDIYDSNGNFIETSQYIQSGLKVLKTTSSYTLSLNKNNSLIVTDRKGSTISELIPRNDINEIFDVETMNIIKCEENNQELEIIIGNPNITVEGKNAYKFNVNKTGSVNFEYINYEN